MALYENQNSRPQHLKYTHLACIDLIIARPEISQNELAREFGYSPAWMSRIVGSDAFQEALAARREQLVDPVITASIESKLKGLANQAIEVVSEKLMANPTLEGGLKALDITSRALGYGARDKATVQVNNFVVSAPGKSANTSEWLEAHRPALPAPTPLG